MPSAKRSERRGGRNSRRKRTKNEKNGERGQKAVTEREGTQQEQGQVLPDVQLREKETEARKEREKGAGRQKRGEMATEAVVATPKLQGEADTHRAVAAPPETDATECKRVRASVRGNF